MSWQSYVDDNLVGSGKVSKAAIIGLQGGVWAASPGYNLSTEEQKAIVDAFKNRDAVQASGLRLAGQKFFTISVDAASELVLLKKQADGATVAKTKQAVLVAEYLAPLQGGESTPIVAALADYLKGVGY